VELFRAQCRALVEQKVDLQAQLRAEADALLALDASGRTLRTELSNANAALEKFYEEKVGMFRGLARLESRRGGTRWTVRVDECVHRARHGVCVMRRR
jgi:hypothetical protein